ncbi:MAG: 30S ribosome-binding factor RbfA [Fibrobacterota bacterium]
MAVNRWHNRRVTENLRREILWIIQNRVKDPRMPEFISIPEIQLAQDTRNATVFVSTLDGSDLEDEVMDVLNKAASFIQREAAQKVKIKNFPRLLFKADDSAENWERINTILDDIKDDLE